MYDDQTRSTLQSDTCRLYACKVSTENTSSACKLPNNVTSKNSRCYNRLKLIETIKDTLTCIDLSLQWWCMFFDDYQKNN